MKDFRKYNIWRRGIELAIRAYNRAKQLPKEEQYGLSSQIKRAAVSIPANIAEGCGRETDKDFKKFLQTALGSAFELETHFIIAEKLCYMQSADVSDFLKELHIEQKQLNALIQRTKGE